MAFRIAIGTGSSWRFEERMGCNSGSARKGALKTQLTSVGKFLQECNRSVPPQPRGIDLRAKLGGGHSKSRLSAWKLSSFQEKEMPGLKTSSLMDVSPGKTQLFPQDASDAFLASSAAVRTTLGVCPRWAGDAKPGGMEPPDSQDMPRPGTETLAVSIPCRGQTCSLLGWR